MTVRIDSRPQVTPLSPAVMPSQPTVQASRPKDLFVAARTVEAPGNEARIQSAFALGNAAVENGFRISTSGAFPPKAAGGFFTKLSQAEKTTSNTLKAAESIATHGKSPSDADVAKQLAGLHETPMYKSDATTHADYTSDIPGATPQSAYDLFVKSPGAVFAAGGLTVRPAVNELKDGQRLMLQAGGTPPVWFPIEVQLDPTNQAIHITTLDGHPFRGTNDFQFVSDGKGGTQVVQKSAFQGSSDLIKTAGQSQLQEQHQTWHGVHDFLYQQLANSTPASGNAVHGEASPKLPLQGLRTINSRIQLPAGAAVQSMKLTLNISDEDPKNLKVWLVNPQGATVPVALSGSSRSGVQGTFDLSAATRGQAVGGTWTLCVTDNGYPAVGSLQGWSLDANAPAAKTAA